MKMHVLLIAMAFSAAAGVAGAAEIYVPQQMVVSLQPGYGIDKINEMNALYGTSTLDAWAEGDLYLLWVPAGEDPDSLSRICEYDPAVTFAEPNYRQWTAEAIRQMAARAERPDAVVAIESRGFIFGAPLAQAAVALIELGPTNHGFDVHQPGGVTATAICRAVQAVTGRAIAYQEFPGGTRAAVDGYPLSDTHKELYAELYDYFRRDTFLGEPLAIAEAIPGFAYGTIEDFVRSELYPSTDGSAVSTHMEENPMIVMAIKHKVRDFGSWKSVYDSYPPTAAGALFARVNRATEDTNDVLVVTGWNTVKEAQAFKSNSELGAKMAAAGVVGPPRFELYEQVEVLGG